MIKASEALPHFNTLNREAYSFIKSIIEPTIIKTMESNTYIKIPCIDFWYYGTVYKIPKGLDFKHNSSDDTLSLNLTNKINDILRENGYIVKSSLDVVGNEYNRGRGNFIISWDKNNDFF